MTPRRRSVRCDHVTFTAAGLAFSTLFPHGIGARSRMAKRPAQ
jgi:hypothetical protein